MKIVEKNGGDLHIITRRPVDVQIGDFLVIWDGFGRSSLIVQVIEETYLNVEGALLEAIREELLESDVQVDEEASSFKSLSNTVRDLILLRCKIRGSIRSGSYVPSIEHLPSRVSSKVEPIPIDRLLESIHPTSSRFVYLGRAGQQSPFSIPLEALDGALTIITGKKGSGKSHLAKLLIRELIQNHAKVVVLDINDEYKGIGYYRDGTPSPICNRVLRLEPSKNLRFTLDYIGKRGVTDILCHALELPTTSLREFLRIWDELEEYGRLTLTDLIETISNRRINDHIKEALISRLLTLASSNLITEDHKLATTFEELFSKIEEGGALILTLNRCTPLIRRIVVEFVLSKLTQLLELGKISPCFLFAEEAHLYLRETYWEDIVTRMRHLGLFTTLITNQPDAIKDCVYRQVDNIFIFNFSSEKDLEAIARVSMIDGDTLKAIVKYIPPRFCLAVGRLTGNLPVLFNCAEADMLTYGETKLFFPTLPVKQRGSTEI
jgi:DNA helicase HerA-like ATPase